MERDTEEEIVVMAEGGVLVDEKRLVEFDDCVVYDGIVDSTLVFPCMLASAGNAEVELPTGALEADRKPGQLIAISVSHTDILFEQECNLQEDD